MPAEAAICTCCKNISDSEVGSGVAPASLRQSEALDSSDTAMPKKDSFNAAGVVYKDRVGTLLGGRYKLIEKLGRGGMGVVYRAKDTRLNSLVAIKVLSEQLEQDLRGIELLKREARTAMRLSHPNIVKLYGYEECPEGRFLVMEYVEGRSLSDLLIEKKRLPEEQVKRFGIEICKGLEHSHSEKVIHRDIKPANVMVEKNGRTKVADFGIARILEDAHTRQTGKATSGTLLYMSPEQIMGRKTDGRSDIYSLGITLYELLEGEPPFKSGDISLQHLRRSIRPIPGISEHLNLILQKCCAKKPEDRFGNAKRLRGALLGKYDFRATESSASFEKKGFGLRSFLREDPLTGMFAILLVMAIAFAGIAQYLPDPGSLSLPSGDIVFDTFEDTDNKPSSYFPLARWDSWVDLNKCKSTCKSDFAVDATQGANGTNSSLKWNYAVHDTCAGFHVNLAGSTMSSVDLSDLKGISFYMKTDAPVWLSIIFGFGPARKAEKLNRNTVNVPPNSEWRKVVIDAGQFDRWQPTDWKRIVELQFIVYRDAFISGTVWIDEIVFHMKEELDRPG